MSRQVSNLLAALETLPDRPDDVRAFLTSRPKVGALPLPQHAWTLLGLLRYHQRKQWAWDVFYKSIFPRLRKRRKRAKVIRSVPGMPEWEYLRALDNVSLRHKGTGETIYLDLFVAREVEIGEEFKAYLQSIRDSGSPMARLSELFPRGSGLQLSLEFLIGQGIISLIDEDMLELTERAMNLAEDAEIFLKKWNNSDDRIWLAACINDWPAAHAEATRRGHDDLVAVTSLRSEESRQRWLEILREKASKNGTENDILLALKTAGAFDPSQLFERTFQTRCVWSTALSLVRDDGWCQLAFEVLSSGTEEAVIDQEDILAIARYLARHRYRIGEVIVILMCMGNPNWSALVELAMDFEPELLAHFVEEALISTSKKHRLTAAAVLAVRDDLTSRKLLTRSLRGKDSRVRTAEARAALRLSRNPRARNAAVEWEEKHSEEEPEATSDSPPDPTGARCETRLLRRMSELRKLIERGHAIPTLTLE